MGHRIQLRRKNSICLLMDESSLRAQKYHIQKDYIYRFRLDSIMSCRKVWFRAQEMYNIIDMVCSYVYDISFWSCSQILLDLWELSPICIMTIPVVLGHSWYCVNASEETFEGMITSPVTKPRQLILAPFACIIRRLYSVIHTAYRDNPLLMPVIKRRHTQLLHCSVSRGFVLSLTVTPSNWVNARMISVAVAITSLEMLSFKKNSRSL